MRWIDEARAAGARKAPACEVLGFSPRTLERWVKDGIVLSDQRPVAKRPAPRNKLTDEERHRIIEVSNEAAYASLPPSQIVPKLADQGEYIASESSFYRVLKSVNQLYPRGRSKKRHRPKPPTTHCAESPNAVWSWDVTYLPTLTRGWFYYLYLIMDIYSRKIVGCEVHEREQGDLAAQLIERSVLTERCYRQPLILHSDNGSPMKSYTMQSKLNDLGITPSHSRPRVSNDNAFSESLFRTLKYCPQWPSHGFRDIEAARKWVSNFVDWYNNQHCHSKINFVTPAQRHQGVHEDILTKRDRLYHQAKARHPERWSGSTRNWCPVTTVTLNPEKQAA